MLPTASQSPSLPLLNLQRSCFGSPWEGFSRFSLLLCVFFWFFDFSAAFLGLFSCSWYSSRCSRKYMFFAVERSQCGGGEGRLDLNSELWGSKTERKGFFSFISFLSFFFSFRVKEMRPTNKQHTKMREIIIIIISVLLFCSWTGRLAAHTPLIRIQWAFERCARCRSTLKRKT